MAYDTTKSIRVDSSEWDRAKEICDELHVSLSTVFNVFLKQIVIHNGIPLNISLNTSDETMEENTVTDIVTEDAEILYASDEPYEEVADDMEDSVENIANETKSGVLADITGSSLKEPEKKQQSSAGKTEHKPIDMEEHERYKNYVSNTESTPNVSFPFLKEPGMENFSGFDNLFDLQGVFS